ncbi:MAG: hypothetical protein V7637_5350 [Mycobacteriales bacterium]
MPAERRAARSRRVLLVLVVVTAVLGGVTLGLNHFAAGGTVQPGVTAAPRRVFACAYDTSTPQDRASGEIGCRRQALDYGRRPPLTPAQLSQATPLARRVDTAVDAAVRTCLDAAVDSCVAVPARTRLVLTPSARGGMVESLTPAVMSAPRALPPIRAALRRAGLDGAVVRLSRAEDPAPPGSIVYAVSVGQMCVVGYQAQRQAGARVLGRLPSGGCLAP